KTKYNVNLIKASNRKDIRKTKHKEDKENLFLLNSSNTSLKSVNSDENVPVYSSSSFAARIKSIKNAGLRSPVTNTETVSAGFLLYQTIFIERQADYAGERFYQVHSRYDGPMQGWMKSNDLKLWNLSETKNHKENFRVTNPKNYLFSDPWGMDEQKIKKFSSYGDQPFKSEKVLTLGSHTYYYGKIGNDYGWVEKRKLHSLDVAPVYTQASFAARIKFIKNAGLRSPVTNTETVSAGFLLDRTIFIERQADYAGERFYQVHSRYDGPMQGWMKSNDLKLWNLSETKNHKENFRVTNPKNYLLSDPWGMDEQKIKKFSSYGDQPFKSEKVLTLGSHTYYYGK